MKAVGAAKGRSDPARHERVFYLSFFTKTLVFGTGKCDYGWAMRIVNDTNRSIISDLFEALGSRPLDRIGENCPLIFHKARDAGLIALGTVSSADAYPTWDWEIGIDDLLILAGPEWSTETKREAVRMIGEITRAIARGFGQATDAELAEAGL